MWRELGTLLSLWTTATSGGSDTGAVAVTPTPRPGHPPLRGMFLFAGNLEREFTNYFSPENIMSFKGMEECVSSFVVDKAGLS